MNFLEAKAKKIELDTDCEAASKKLNEVKGSGKVQMGLTPDHIKTLPAYQAAKQEFDKTFQALREFNAYYTKNFKKELSVERKKK